QRHFQFHCLSIALSTRERLEYTLGGAGILEMNSAECANADGGDFDELDARLRRAAFSALKAFPIGNGPDQTASLASLSVNSTISGFQSSQNIHCCCLSYIAMLCSSLNDARGLENDCNTGRVAGALSSAARPATHSDFSKPEAARPSHSSIVEDGMLEIIPCVKGAEARVRAVDGRADCALLLRRSKPSRKGHCAEIMGLRARCWILGGVLGKRMPTRVFADFHPRGWVRHIPLGYINVFFEYNFVVMLFCSVDRGPRYVPESNTLDSGSLLSLFFTPMTLQSYSVIFGFELIHLLIRYFTVGDLAHPLVYLLGYTTLRLRLRGPTLRLRLRGPTTSTTRDYLP
ncbi:hypothetical protein GGF50DRAFT_93178, partial [Schizophyllum commune]